MIRFPTHLGIIRLAKPQRFLLTLKMQAMIFQYADIAFNGMDPNSNGCPLEPNPSTTAAMLTFSGDTCIRRIGSGVE